MKHCRLCKTTYPDTLEYCTKDGTTLTFGVPSEELAAATRRFAVAAGEEISETQPDTVRDREPSALSGGQSSVRGSTLLTIPPRYLKPLSKAAYALLWGGVLVLILINRPPRYITVLFVAAALAVLICDVIATQSARFTASLIAQRGWIAGAVMILCVVACAALTVATGLGAIDHGIGAVFKLAMQNALRNGFVILAQFALQGALVGVVVRVLTWAMFARLLRGGPIEISRLLLLASFTVLLWLFPLGESHRIYAGLYIFGFGAGYMIHYLVRYKEHTRAQTARLGRNIVESLGHVKLLPKEFEAIGYYANQKWRRLDRLLQEQQPLSTVLVIVKASRLRLNGQYARARAIIDAELNTEQPDQVLRTYLYLNLALNLADIGGLRPQMHAALNKALECHGDCLLSLVTTGLRTAEELSLEMGADGPGAEDPRRKIALKCIWEALKINDVVRPEPVARIVGRAVPVTWTFLLDAYAYVLLKAGHVRFSKALLMECIYEDPYFSSPYLHLGEWCIADLLKARRQLGAMENFQSNRERAALLASAERSRRVGRLCLNIAVQLEGKRPSLTRRRAGKLLKSYHYLLFDER